MAFQIKNFTSIVGAAINHMRGTQNQVTDFNVGSVARTMIEAPSIEMDELYQQMLNGLVEAIPVATYNSFNFNRLPARAATGLIKVTIAAQTVDVAIAAGAKFTGATSKGVYRSTQDVVILAGLTEVDVLVVAETAGVVGNILAGETFSMGPRPTGFVEATNETAFVDGSDVESDDQRKERFIDFITTLQRGTVAAVSFGTRSTVLRNADGAEIERVRAAAVIEPYLTDVNAPISLVNVYIHNGAGGTSDALVAEVVKVLHGYTTEAGDKVPGWKAAGVKVVVAKATEVPLDLAAELTPKPGFDGAALAAAAENVLSEYVRSIDISGSFLIAQAIFLVKSMEGVENFVFSDPTVDVASDDDEKLVGGTISVTAA